MYGVFWLTHAASLILCFFTLSIAMEIPRNGERGHSQSSRVVLQARSESISARNATFSIAASMNQSQFEYHLPFVAFKTPQCHGTSLGFNLDRDSCFDAWRSMALSKQRTSWGQRGTSEHYGVRLPYRWSSGDGKCVIDVVHDDQQSFDFATFLDITNAAEEVMKACVDLPRTPSAGGYIGGIGENGNLVVAVREYIPNVTCGSSWTAQDPSTLCHDTLSILPVFTMSSLFGNRPGTQWSVPLDVTAAHSDCQAQVSIVRTTRIERMTWFDIWAAAVAIDAVCVRHGHTGVASRIGVSGDGWVALQSQSNPPTLTISNE